MSNQVLRVQALISSVWRTIATTTVDEGASADHQQRELLRKFTMKESVWVGETVIFPREFPALRVLVESEKDTE